MFSGRMNYRMSVPHLFEKKSYATPVSCASCKKKIWGKGYFCPVCKSRTHVECVQAYIENSTCISDLGPLPPTGGSNITSSISSGELNVVANAPPEEEQRKTPGKIELVRQDSGKREKSQAPDSFRNRMGNQRLGPTMSAPSLASVIHPSVSQETGKEVTEEPLSPSTSNPNLPTSGLNRRLEGDFNRVYSAPDFKRNNSSVNNLLSGNDNEGGSLETEESLRLDNLVLQNMRTKIRIDWAKQKKAKQGEAKTPIQTMGATIKKRTELMRALIDIEERKLKLVEQLEEMEKEHTEVSVQMLESLQSCAQGMEPIYSAYLSVMEDPPATLNQELIFSQRSLTALEGTLLYQDFDRLQLQLLEVDANAMKTRNEQFEAILQQFMEEERQLGDRVSEFTVLGEKLCVIEQNLAKYQQHFANVEQRLSIEDLTPVVETIASKSDDTRKLFASHSTESQEDKIINLCYISSASIPEEVDSKDLIFMKKERTAECHPVVRAGTVDKLVERLTWAAYPDPLFQKAFLLTYRSFMTPQQLLQKLILRYCITPPPSELQLSIVKKKFQVPIQLRVLNVIKYWMENYMHDFMEDELSTSLDHFLTNIVSVLNSRYAVSLKGLLQKKLSKATAEKQKMFSKPAPEPILPRDLRSFVFEELDPLEIARQLTLIEYSIFKTIQPKEFLNQGWSKSKKEINSPNILAMIRLFNKISRWVTGEVVFTDDLLSRSEKMKKFIRIASECYKMSNLNAVMEITAGLSNASVLRLKRTWEGLGPESTEMFQSMKQLMENNFSKFRAHLQSCNPPCLPYMGVFLTDLTFAEDGNPNMIDHMVNFAKLRQVADIIRSVQEYQQEDYNFTPIRPIQDWILNLPEYDEAETYQQSLRAESRKLDKMLGKVEPAI